MPPSPTKLSHELFTVFDGQHQINHHQIRKLHSTLSQRGPNVSRRYYLIAFLLEHRLQQVPHGRIVVEN
jgi:hypothetical protein